MQMGGPCCCNGKRHTPCVLVAIPVYNEEKYVTRVLERVRRHAKDVLVIDDGSTDETPMLLAKQPVEVIRHADNRGYGRSLRDAFRWASCYRYEWIITMDCDEQHEPAALPDFVAAATADTHDIISGSRYMPQSSAVDSPPADRREINATITAEINDRLGLNLTDAFCGFKAYRVSALEKLRLTENGYAFPMQFWVQAAAMGLRICEIPIKLIYNDLNRSFGGPLNDPATRLAVYRDVLHKELDRCAPMLSSREGRSRIACP